MAMYKQMAKLEKTIKNNVAEVYACFIKVLYEEGNDLETIEALVLKTQDAWVENVDRMDTMIEWCEEVTGIDVKAI